MANRIASILIRGTVVGSATGGDHFGISAGAVGAFRSLNFIAPLTPGLDIIQLSPVTGDGRIREI